MIDFGYNRAKTYNFQLEQSEANASPLRLKLKNSSAVIRFPFWAELGWARALGSVVLL